MRDGYVPGMIVPYVLGALILLAWLCRITRPLLATTHSPH
eukprot:COSAG02_NODE_43921_length_370_cov_1.036900_1_plen_39_part_01